MKHIRVALAFCRATVAHAQSYPNKQVRLIAPQVAGGGADVLARLLTQKLTEAGASR